MKKIKLLIMDVDGTLTDGKIHLSKNGELFKTFDIKDGCGIHDLLPQANIVPIVMTARASDIVENRCRELGIRHYYQNCRDKKAVIDKLAKQFGINPDSYGVYQEIAYIGDDIIDLPAMSSCGILGCPNDAVPKIQQIADFISSKDGGDGAVREFIEWILMQ